MGRLGGIKREGVRRREEIHFYGRGDEANRAFGRQCSGCCALPVQDWVLRLG